MRKILTSLVTISAMSIMVFGATQAYFNDEETSSGNTFTAGSLDLEVDSTCHYDGMVCVANDSDGFTWQEESGNSSTRPELINLPCDCTWPEKSLTSEKFFKFSDLKPGDYGESTISLHVIDNNAWACALIDQMQNDDNTCTEPEGVAEADATCGEDVGGGELAQALHFFAWADDGNNVWEAGEPPLFSNVEGPASDILDGVVYPLADSTTEGNALDLTEPQAYFVESETYNIGIAWCAGTMTVNETAHTITCDSDGMGNETQTDSLAADISFHAEQWRNNPDFSCGSLVD